MTYVNCFAGCFFLQCFDSNLESNWFPVCDQADTDGLMRHMSEYTQEAVCTKPKLRLGAAIRVEDECACRWRLLL